MAPHPSEQTLSFGRKSCSSKPGCGILTSLQGSMSPASWGNCRRALCHSMGTLTMVVGGRYSVLVASGKSTQLRGTEVSKLTAQFVSSRTSAAT